MLCLSGVTRIAASFRLGRWDDVDAEVMPLALADLSDTVEAIRSDVYGWEFFDPPEESWSAWRDRLSFDERFAAGEAAHVIDLFQETGSAAHLDFRVWFDEVWIEHRGERRPTHEVIANADRWWRAMYAGDPATAGHGIVPAAPLSPPRRRRWWSRRRS